MTTINYYLGVEGTAVRRGYDEEVIDGGRDMAELQRLAELLLPVMTPNAAIEEALPMLDATARAEVMSIIDQHGGLER